MAQKPLSTLFEEKLSQRKFEMKDAYWQDAEELIIQSNKKKKRRRFLYFFMAFLFLGTSLYSAFYYSNNDKPGKNPKIDSQAKQKAEMITIQNAAPEIANTNEKPIKTESPVLPVEKENQKDSESKAMNSASPRPDHEKTQQNPTTPVLIYQKESSDPNPQIIEETPDETSVPLKEQMLVETNDKKKETTIPVVPVSEEEPVEDLLIAGYKSVEEQSVFEITENKALEDDNIDETTLDVSANDNDSYIKQVEATIPDDDLDYTIEADSIIHKNKESGISNPSSSDGFIDDPSPLVSGNPSDSIVVAAIIKDSVMNSSKASPFSLSLYGGLSSVQKLLTSQEENLGSHIAKRKTEEQPILTFAAGMELNYQPNRWLVSTGIYYNEYGEKINYSPNVYEQERISSSGFWTIATFTYDSSDSLGNPIIVTLRDSNYNEVLTTDTITITDKRITEQNGNTKLAYFEIPVLVGYECSLKNMSIITRTGVSVGYLLNSNGHYVTQDNAQLQDIGTKEGLVHSFSINYLLKAGIHYPMGEMATIFVEPRFKINLQSILEKSNNVSQRYYVYGVNLGIKYKF